MAEKSPIAKAWTGLGIVIGVGVAIVAIVIVGGALIQLVLDSFGSQLGGISNSMQQAGNALANFTSGIRAVMGGIGRIVITLALYAVIIIWVAVIAKLIIDEAKKKIGKP